MANLGRAVLFKQMDRLYRDGSFTSQDDAHLLERYLTGRDDGAFEAIVNLHGPMILALCRRFLRDPRDIEDAFQATFLILASRAETIRKREVLSSWLYGVAYRVATRCRSEVMRRRSLEIGAAGLEAPDRTYTACDEIGPALDQELSRLPEKYRAPIVLCYLKEQTHDQAAAALRWPVGTVRSRLARGRELLKERLTRRGYAPASAVFGFGRSLPVGSFTAVVPQPLVEATVAAVGRGAWSSGPAILFPSLSMSFSGSVTTLAQGVLTTMAFSQVKWIGAGMAALGMMVGGAGAWALAAARPGEQADKAPQVKTVEKVAPRAEVRDVNPVPPRDAAPQAGGPNVEARLADLERKLDQLLRLLGPKGRNTPAVPPPVAPGALQPLPALPAANPGGVLDTVPVPSSDVTPVPTSDLPPQPRAEVALTPGAPQPQPINPPTPRADVDQASVDLIRRAQQVPFELDQPSSAPVERSPFEQDNTPPAPRPGRRRPRALPSPGTPAPVAPSNDDTRAPEVPSAPGEPPSYDDVANPGTRRQRREAPDIQFLTRTSLKELRAQLQVAQLQLERNKTLFSNGIVGRDQLESSLGQIRVLVGRLEGWDEDLAEEDARLRVEVAKKQADVNVALAQTEITQSIVARNSRLNQRKPGMVSQEDVAKAEAEHKGAEATVELRRAELLEIKLKTTQLRRRRELIRQAVEVVLKTTPDLAREGVQFTQPANPASDLPR
jgi:RNA polymerase sigma factor (sigma-70 family)